MKRIFFTCTIAVFAVAGAYAGNFVYDLGGSRELRFSCHSGGTGCAEFIVCPSGYFTDVTDPANPTLIVDQAIFIGLSITAE